MLFERLMILMQTFSLEELLSYQTFKVKVEVTMELAKYWESESVELTKYTYYNKVNPFYPFDVSL